MSEDSYIDPTDHSPDEPIEDEQAFPSSPPTGNRPAEGAQRKLPGEAFTDSFQGSETAGFRSRAGRIAVRDGAATTGHARSGR